MNDSEKVYLGLNHGKIYKNTVKHYNSYLAHEIIYIPTTKAKISHNVTQPNLDDILSPSWCVTKVATFEELLILPT